MNARSEPYQPAPTLPALDAPAPLWRAFAGRLEPALRTALYAQLGALSPEVLRAVVPTLLCRSRGGAHTLALRAVLDAVRVPDDPVLALVLLAEALGPSSAARAQVLPLLAECEPRVSRALGLALWLCAHVRAARGAGPRELATWELWCRLGGPRPEIDPAAPEALWRRWMQGDKQVDGLELALLFACAGAPRASAEWLCAALSRVLERHPAACEEAAELAAWLASESGRREDRPPWVAQVEWRPAAARVLAATALSAQGVAMTLLELARRWPHDARLRPVALSVLDALREAPQRLGAERPELLAQAGAAWAHALTEARDGADAHGAVVAALLGERTPGVWGWHWLTEQARVDVLRAALQNPALRALEVAVRELEAHGVPLSLRPALQEREREALESVLRARLRALLATPAAMGLSPR